ncbi:PREDICTED: chymotrypsin-2-like [Dinoponera quadriceps]|uniref:chymotrypsin n=1 Tax=Dinoponera quadriceps TaxID=609295 RepID=A0A6P3Y9S6_DINQU|nr:PREDICTED: chymotrypsin-2-like [Dinoponera quadriceps]
MALTALSLLSLLALSQAKVIQPFLDPRIVNGEDAKPGEIPYQVSLQNKGSNFHFCGGSVLNDNYVITAAHCVDGKQPGSLQVIAGTINLNNPKSKHEVEQIIVHKEYNPSNSWRNDIALLKVKTPFVTSADISHIPLPPKGHVVNAEDVAVVSGWGRLWESGPTTEKLQRVNIQIADQDSCKRKYNAMGYNVHATQVCAYDPTTSKGSCNGDSGGPLTVGGKLVGLVSWAYGCASTNYPTVYTRVVSFLDWINANAV